MPKVCEICSRGPVFGRSISHSHRVTSRKWQPNLQRVKIKQNGGHRYVWVCTRCLRSGKVEKAL